MQTVETRRRATVEIVPEAFDELPPRFKDLVLDALLGLDILSQDYDVDRGVIVLHVSGEELAADVYDILLSEDGPRARLVPRKHTL